MTRTSSARPPRHWLLGLALIVIACLAGPVASSSAAAARAEWAVQSVASPTNFTTAQNEACESVEVCDEYLVTATNVGTAASKGVIKLTDKLPPGMVTVIHRVEHHNEFPLNEGGEPVPCSPPSPTPEFSCEVSEPVGPGGVIQMFIWVKLEEGTESTALNHVELEEEGGLQGLVTTSEPSTMPNTVNQAEPAFGVQDFSVGVYGGSQTGADTLAGDRPSAFTVNIHYKSKPNAVGGGEAVEEPRASIVDLPMGFVGNTLAAAQCPESTLYGKGQPRQCPAASEVGVIALQNQQENQRYRIYNMVPEPGYPATFAFEIAETNVLMPARVIPTAEGYVLSVAVPAIPRSKIVKISGFSLTFFGDPGAQNGTGSQVALFSNPVDCGAAPLKARIETDSWVNPGRWVVAEAPVYEADPAHAVSGCDALQFNPSFDASVEGGADSPAALNLHIAIPQAPFVESVRATPDLRDLEVQLPEGLTLSPSAATGLVSCPATGPEGIELGNVDGPSHEAHAGEAIGEDGVPHAVAGHCPAASTIGTLEAQTPVLAAPLTGHLYLAEPECGTPAHPAPCSEADVESGRAFRVYAELEGSGVVVKVPGEATANAATGRLTTRFENNPQFPLSDLKVHVNGGPRAPLATPQSCGVSTILGVFTPWSAPESGGASQVPASVDIAGCPATTVFAPLVLAQATQTQALAHPSFSFRLERRDGEPYVTRTTVKLPPGLLANIGAVPRCSNASAASASCPAGSAIGDVKTALGAGSSPFETTGAVYLTESYAGSPFGLAIVVPTKAGPFTLAGNTGRGEEVVRAGIQIDPNTTAVTIHSDPLPQVVDGVPLRLRGITVNVNRAGFMVNPTNCKQQSVLTTVEGAGGASAVIGRPFAVTGCKGLPFAPKMTVSSLAATSRGEGASLHVKLVAKPGEANIATVKVVLPKQLPSRLTTLQKACPDATFAANPASCPAASAVGTAIAVTPLLKAHLTGPAYLVSHAGAAFPDLVIVLQGEGVTIHLTGNTLIRNGITSSTFRTVPDAPVSSFELELPRGPHSVLGAFLPARAHNSLCGQKLQMPTRITGQNGGVVQQTTKIAVNGCHKKKAKKGKARRR